MERKIMQFTYPYGATPLDPNEIEGLIPIHISTLPELNTWEQANILEVEEWLNKNQFNTKDVMAVDFIKQIHFKMFNKTWKWAGQFRKTNKNIGIDWPLIATHLKHLLDDIHYQLSYKTYDIDEIATRFHHRLVSIHLFPNGNGRHARLMTDLLLISENKPRFSWGQNNLNEMIITRRQYIEALRSADQHHYQLLLDFVRK
jgi:Fic-DOC domain mobile mystery protein B